MYAYTVRATFADPDMADAWIAWLVGGHIDAVLAAGALNADIVRLDAAGLNALEVRYAFADADAFRAYERDHAPRLRAEGAARFPPSEVAYDRSDGPIVWASYP